jgi:hypothetical protein
MFRINRKGEIIDEITRRTVGKIQKGKYIIRKTHRQVFFKFGPSFGLSEEIIDILRKRKIRKVEIWFYGWGKKHRIWQVRTSDFHKSKLTHTNHITGDKQKFLTIGTIKKLSKKYA